MAENYFDQIVRKIPEASKYFTALAVRETELFGFHRAKRFARLQRAIERSELNSADFVAQQGLFEERHSAKQVG